MAAALPCIAGSARADFEPVSRSWAGLSELVALAAELDIELMAHGELNLESLRSTDGLLLVHPSHAPPSADLVAFMREGGRVGVVDDFGSGEPLMEVFHITRHPLTAPEQARRLRDNRNVLIATPRAEHPLSRDVLALVVNHPQALHHQSLQPIFALSDNADPVVLAGGVGRGRLVAVSDASVLINNMLEFRGNRGFAGNLLRYLARDGRLHLVVERGVLEGHYGGGPSSPTSRLSARLSELTARPLPPNTVLLLSLGIVGLLLFVAATTLPLRSTYLRAVTLKPPEVVAGFAGRVAFFSTGTRNLLPPLMSYKLAFERDLLDRLGLPGQAQLRDVLAALREAGLAQPAIDDAQKLLRELESLRAAQDRVASPPSVGRRRFRAMIARGDRILSALHAR